MQPLISPIDHEGRHSLNNTDNEQRPTEHTPLLRTQHETRIGHDGLNSPREPRDVLANMVVTLLIIVFLSGLAIGIYLLIVQSNSENILPPVETPLQFVSKSQWNSNSKGPQLSLTPFRAKEVIVVQTDTEPCYSVATCKLLLRNLELNQTEQKLPYNFLLSSNGQAYEALGWLQSSTMFLQYPNSLVLAFIGNFTEKPPSRAQLDEARDFFAESVSLRYLDPSYSIIGKSTKVTPKYLFKSLITFPHWNSELTDKF